MAIAFSKPRDRLIKKIIEYDNADRIGQWINWNALAKNQPEKFKVCRIGIDFALFMKVCDIWLTAGYSDRIKPSKPNLFVVG